MSTPEAPATPPDRNESLADDGLARLMELTGDIAMLPAGSRLTDESRPGHQCFVLLDGAATVERDGRPVRGLASGAFVGDVSPDGRPLPPAGAMLTARPAAAEALFLAAWRAHEEAVTAGDEEPAEAAAAAEAAAGLALIYGNASSAGQCGLWTRRSLQAGPGRVPPAVLGAQAMARALAGEARLALRRLSGLPAAPALVPDAQADAPTVRGLLRLWTGDECGADDDLTAVVAGISGARLRASLALARGFAKLGVRTRYQLAARLRPVPPQPDRAASPGGDHQPR